MSGRSTSAKFSSWNLWKFSLSINLVKNFTFFRQKITFFHKKKVFSHKVAKHLTKFFQNQFKINKSSKEIFFFKLFSNWTPSLTFSKGPQKSMEFKIKKWFSESGKLKKARRKFKNLHVSIEKVFKKKTRSENFNHHEKKICFFFKQKLKN